MAVYSMPFELAISKIEYRDTEIEISGRLVSGSYSGPEAVAVRLNDGSQLHSVVTHHSLRHPEDWPVLPAHRDTVLTLTIDRPSRAVRFDESGGVVGRGSLFLNANRVDISDDLKTPVFWALWLDSALEGDQIEEPHRECFGVPIDEVNRYYDQAYDRRFDKGVWPFVRMAAGDGRYVEVEFSAGVEYQNRFWIEHGDRRAMLGYHSGHFSLPAFRVEEIAGLAEDASGIADAAALLTLLTSVYVPSSDTSLVPLVARLFDQLPGVAIPSPRLAEVFADKQTVADIEWTEDPELGWVNCSRYSQRNPDSAMSVLSKSDFELITSFFTASAPPAG